MDNNILTQARSEASVSSFISRVFLVMAAGLGVSALGSWWLLSQPNLLMAIVKNPMIFLGLAVVEIALVIWLSAGIMTMGTGLAALLFFGYSFLNGVTITPLLLVYTGASVMTTFAVTSGTFFFFALYGLTTKRDLTSMGGLLMMGLIGVILASLVNMFVHSSGLYWVITYVGIAVFMGLVAWDTQKLKTMHAMGGGESRLVILGALRLYLDFINLFIMLLRIFGKQRN